MIKNLTLLKPNKENLNLYVSLGGVFFVLGIADVTFNIFGFLPTWFSFFVPLVFCFLDFHKYNLLMVRLIPLHYKLG